MAEKKKAVPAAPEASDKKKALEAAISKIEKDYGKGTIMRLGDDIPVNVEALSTGSLSLDLALGIGGVPKGRIVEIYGPEASGKTTLALHVVASAQRAGGQGLHIHGNIVSQAHDGSLAVVLLDLGDGGLKGFLLVARFGGRGDGLFLLCHNEFSFISLTVSVSNAKVRCPAWTFCR